MDELFYKHVLVHPELDQDPQNKQGQVGRLSNIVHENDEACVYFGNDSYGYYETDALLMLLPPDKVLENLKAGLSDMDRRDVLDLLDIYLLQVSHRSEMITEAIWLAAGNLGIYDKALISLRDWIDNGLSDDYNYGADWQPGRGM